MQSAPLTEDETARLKALYDYDILDSAAEKVFDDLTQLASEICHTPMALISLVDPNRQWFKSALGTDVKETPREIAFCAHAIHQRSIFQVEDALLDKRFFDNPLVTQDPNIRFYAGTPLITPEGHAIGTLCAIDSVPRKLTEMQVNALEILGRNVISQMELRKKIKTLKTIDRNKSDFLSHMSHELRTPLNAIIGFSQLLLNDAKQIPLDSKYIGYLNHIDYSGKRLLSVINAILDINKIEAGMMTLDLSATNLPKVIKQVTGMLAISLAEKNIHLQTQLNEELPETLMLDEAKFSQIVINLVSNAIKYTAKNKQIMLRISSHQHKLIIEVKDQGDGISPADQQKLFNKFQQFDNAKSQQGSGLGLAITKGLVDLMQGKISVQSQQQNGTTFTVTLPLIVSVEPPTEARSEVPLSKSFNPGSRILVVEDNEINQAVIEAMLENLQLSATYVQSGEEALDVSQKNDFDLILMDIHLPGINGIETSQKILAQQPDLPIIALSADSFEQEKMKRGRPVFREFLTKPIEIESLVATLQRFLP